MSDVKLTEAQKSVLRTLSNADEDFSYYSFRAISRRNKLRIPDVRIACRALARKGLARYGRGLFTEDGDLAGSGYAITSAGRAALSQKGSAHV